MAAVLWCCHVRGPDDVYAAPDYETALKWSDTVNAMNFQAGRPPATFEEMLLKAVPAPWPHSPESHAQDLPGSIAGWANYSQGAGK